MEGVELVDFHHVEIFLHHVHVEEMSHHVHVHTSVSEPWGILDPAARQAPVLLCGCLLSEDLDRKHLLDGLDGIDEAVESGCLYLDSFSADLEPVCLLRKVLVDAECESCRGGAFHDLAFCSGGRRKRLCKSPYGRL